MCAKFISIFIALLFSNRLPSLERNKFEMNIIFISLSVMLQRKMIQNFVNIFLFRSVC